MTPPYEKFYLVSVFLDMFLLRKKFTEAEFVRFYVNLKTYLSDAIPKRNLILQKNFESHSRLFFTVYMMSQNTEILKKNFTEKHYN